MKSLSLLLLVIMLKRVMVTVISSKEKAEENSLVECHTLVGCGPCVSHAGCVFCRDQNFTEEARCGTRLVLFRYFIVIMVLFRYLIVFTIFF